jgi:hypothetical protein
MSDRLYRWFVVCLLVFVVLPLTAGAVAVWWFFRPVDYGARPAGWVFQQVFRQPVPQGVSDLRIAGHGFCQGHEVWMRFRATKKVLMQLLPESAEKREQLSDMLGGELGSTYERRLAEDDPQAVGWDEVLRMRAPEAHDFSRTSQGAGWYGLFVLDRGRQLVYVHVGIL